MAIQPIVATTIHIATAAALDIGPASSILAQRLRRCSAEVRAMTRTARVHASAASCDTLTGHRHTADASLPRSRPAPFMRRMCQEYGKYPSLTQRAVVATE